MFIDLTVSNVYPTASKWSPEHIKAYKARKGDLLINLEQYLHDGCNVLDANKIQQSVFHRATSMFLSLVIMQMKMRPSG